MQDAAEPNANACQHYIIMDSDLWKLWLSTSRQFGFKDIENSWQENTKFVRLLLHVAASLNPTVLCSKELNHRNMKAVELSKSSGDDPENSICEVVKAVKNDETDIIALFNDHVDSTLPSLNLCSAEQKLRPSKTRKLPQSLASSHTFSDSEARISVNNEEPVDRMKCQYCDKTFRDHRGITVHKQIVHAKHITADKDKSLICSECGKSFNTALYLKNHVQATHGGQEYACNKCDKKFASDLRRYKHIRVVHGTQLTVCDQCGKTYKSPEALKVHMQVVHEGVRYKCTQCDKCYTARHHLTDHVASVHHRREPLQCDTCSTTCWSLSHLRRHKATHRSPHLPCPYCDKLFRQYRDLRLHQVSHSDEKRFTCSVCGKSFKRKSHLKRHMMDLHDVIRVESVEVVCQQDD